MVLFYIALNLFCHISISMAEKPIATQLLKFASRLFWAINTRMVHVTKYESRLMSGFGISVFVKRGLLDRYENSLLRAKSFPVSINDTAQLIVGLLIIFWPCRHPFDSSKWGRICQFLIVDGVLHKNRIVEPAEATKDDLLVVLLTFKGQKL